MTKIFEHRFFKVYIYGHDHNPPHVHIVGRGREARIVISTLECYFLRGFEERDLKLIIKYLKNRKEDLLEKWQEIQND